MLNQSPSQMVLSVFDQCSHLLVMQGESLGDHWDLFNLRVLYMWMGVDSIMQCDWINNLFLRGFISIQRSSHCPTSRTDWQEWKALATTFVQNRNQGKHSFCISLTGFIPLMHLVYYKFFVKIHTDETMGSKGITTGILEEISNTFFL